MRYCIDSSCPTVLLTTSYVETLHTSLLLILFWDLVQLIEHRKRIAYE